ncbi:hypothetical protein APA_1657 [Pseudanabaena sp. lw0831]|nr:hypothetical protein APA_1657 [Pseudanabaena sp. lw0831]
MNSHYVNKLILMKVRQRLTFIKINLGFSPPQVVKTQDWFHNLN